MGRWPDGLPYGLGHAAFGLLVMAGAAPLAWLVTFSAVPVLWVAYLVEVSWWASRERRDAELKAPAINPHTEWHKRWNPFTWSRGDLFGPIVLHGLPCAVVEWLAR